MHSARFCSLNKSAAVPRPVWVYCGNQAKCAGLWKQCWLKHVAHPEASKPQKEGPRIPWTSGTIDVDLKSDPLKNKKDGEKVGGGVTGGQG